MKTELLAPAKNIETAKAAIDAGADAVYIGGPGFGARHNAGNSLEDIKELVDYAHKFYVKVMVTVNTIIKDSELNEVKKLIISLYEAGVDALIVQDMAIIKWAIDGEIPDIPLHISTQCNNRTEEKVNFFNRIGLSRVVLARELSVKQIKEIIEKNPEIEIETFIHGALCVSYSGQCYMSQFIGGRSANRGECAQPCRKKYTLIDDKGNILAKDKHLLSLKDFNATEYIKDLVDIGVKSFKIEGRLKDRNYVSNVVLYYRNLIDNYSENTSSGKVFTNFTPDVNKTFNRGYTNYFLDKREECFNLNTPKFIGDRIGKVLEIKNDSFRIKLNSGIKLCPQDGLVFDKSGEVGCLINRADNNLIYPNKMPDIKAGQSVYRNVDTAFEKELSAAKICRKIGVSIKVENSLISATDEDSNNAKVIITESEKPKNSDKNKENFEKSMHKTGETDFYLNDIDIQSELPFIPISKMNEYRRELLSKLMDDRIKNYKYEKLKSLNYADYYETTLDYRGNVYNSVAKEFFRKCGVNVREYAPESKLPVNDFELMRTKHCIKYALNMCKSPKQLFLVDDRGQEYNLKFDCDKCEMVILPKSKA